MVAFGLGNAKSAAQTLTSIGIQNVMRLGLVRHDLENHSICHRVSPAGQRLPRKAYAV